MQTQKDLRKILTEDISLFDVHFIIKHILVEKSDKENLFNFLFDKEDTIAYRTAWIMTHFSDKEGAYFQDKTNVLFEELIKSNHVGKRRLILSIIYKNKLGIEPISIELLNYCLERMTSQIEPSGIRALCVKIAYNLCCKTPELLQEFTLMLQSMQEETSPAILSVVRNTQKKINRKK